MTMIDSFSFSITRVSHPEAHLCSIDYSYYLNIDPKQYQQHTSFGVTVALFGDDFLTNKMLGESPYDSHVVDYNTPMPQNRRFALPCEILNEAVGKDKIFLRIYINASSGETLSEKSATITDYF